MLLTMIYDMKINKNLINLYLMASSFAGNALRKCHSHNKILKTIIHISNSRVWQSNIKEFACLFLIDPLPSHL